MELVLPFSLQKYSKLTKNLFITIFTSPRTDNDQKVEEKSVNLSTTVDTLVPSIVLEEATDDITNHSSYKGTVKKIIRSGLVSNLESGMGISRSYLFFKSSLDNLIK